MIEHRFPEGFLWGAATSAFQVEGATRTDGRGETIWERFAPAHASGRGSDASAGQTAERACEHYHRFRQDLLLARELGLPSYRFSTAWARVFPQGGGRHNPAGIDFYNRLVDGLLALGIVPVLTLYHWDLPQALQERGGWPARDTARYFADYAAFMFERLADRVKRWITHDGPFAAAFLGHKTGTHAPGQRDEAAALQAAHHLLLSHALASRVFQEHRRGDGRIGIALDLHPVYAASQDPQDQEAAALCDAYHNRWFLDPLLRGAYPQELLERYRGCLGAPRQEEGDLEGLPPPDFVGVNYSSRLIVRRPQRRDALFARVSPDYPGARFTATGREICPEGLYDLLTRLDRDYRQPELYVTANGAAFPDDQVVDGRVADEDRIDYLRRHIAAAGRALQAGVRLRAYCVRSLLDGFEWNHGYSRRYGLVHVDFATQVRRPKKSALWFREVTASGGV